MQHLKARQLQGGGGWHFTTTLDKYTFPVGYCANHDGHETEDEAIACYREYLLNERLRLNGKLRGEQRPCKICGSWTADFAIIDNWNLYSLCDEHRTAEVVAGLFEGYGESWQS